MDLPALITTYGYPLVVLGAVLEGETVLIAAGYLAHRHGIELWKVIACAAAGGTFGDQVFFLLGRAYGEKLVARLPHRLGARVARARAAVQRNPVRVLVSMRFVYGMRIILPVLCGASGIGLGRYVRYNVATAVVWATLIVGLGYAFGAAAEAILVQVERYELFVVAALVVAAVALHFFSKWLRDRVTPGDGS